ncbi:hypothetical protein K435DRAFT_968584 [Dendrothele bispora CBS 962.96]|uniref:DRBM domain-containing protein n=1 Tax=Dendrothele bispora (strain CBS 962.96) TaxID=1314807 RepID=A0A4S8LNB9_DENBC|nr:hypothetical protein K435DRAFT_968584 [Dendrothele bispora CBS 962.96]
MEHCRNQLNNFGSAHKVKPVYFDTFCGPQHASTWETAVFINGQQYGAGLGASKGQARENAARIALQVIRSTGGIDLGTTQASRQHS